MNALALAPFALLFASAPRPQDPPSQADWRLQVEVDPPRPLLVKQAGKEPRIAWYSTFTVTNKTGAARKPVILAKLATDTEKTVTAGYDPHAVAALKSEAPDATVVTDWSETLEDGASKKLVAVFSEVDRHANFLEVRLSGVASALGRHRGEWFEQVVEHRAKFHRPGSERNPENNPVSPVGSEWVVVSKKKIRG